MSNLNRRLGALEARLSEAKQPVNVLDAAKRSLERMTAGLGLAELARSGGLKAWVARYFGASWLGGQHGLDVLVLAGPAVAAVRREDADRVLVDTLGVFGGLYCAPPDGPAAPERHETESGEA